MNQLPLRPEFYQFEDVTSAKLVPFSTSSGRVDIPASARSSTMVLVVDDWSSGESLEPS